MLLCFYVFLGFFQPRLGSIIVANCDSVKTITAGLFAELPSLETVTFELNFNLREIAPGAFRNSARVKTLALIGNQGLVSLRSGCFDGLVSLQALTLRFDKGGLQVIPMDWQTDFRRLKHLHLQVNLKLYIIM